MVVRKRRKYLDSLTLHNDTSNSVTDIKAFCVELEAIRKQGFAIDNEGFLRGLISVAVPVFGNRRSIIGTLALHVASHHMNLEVAKEKIPLLRAAAVNIRDLYLMRNSGVAKSI